MKYEPMLPDAGPLPKASRRAQFDHDLNCNIFGFLKRLDDSSVAFVESFNRVGKRVRRYKLLLLRMRWESATGIMFTHSPLIEEHDLSDIRRIARRTASVMFQVWQLKRVQLKAFEMAFGRDMDGRIRLVDIDPQSWILCHEGRELVMAGNPETDYADALPDLELAVSLSDDFRTMSIDR